MSKTSSVYPVGVVQFLREKQIRGKCELNTDYKCILEELEQGLTNIEEIFSNELDE